MHGSATHSLGLFSRAVLRRLVSILIPAALLPGCVVAALYYRDLASEQTLYEQAGAHLVDLHADIITRELKSVESDLLYLANQAILKDFLSGATAGKQALQDEYLLFSGQKALYDQIRYLDVHGREIIRVNFNYGQPVVVPDRELQSKAARSYFTQTMTLERGEIFISPFDLNVEHDQIEQPLKPVIRFATPVFDRAGVKRGVLVLNYLGVVLLGKLGEVSVTFRGSTLLLNPDGYLLRGLYPGDEWGFMLGRERTFATYFPEEWPLLAGTEVGRLQSKHGLFAFRTLAPRAELPAVRQAPPSSAPAGRADPDAGDAALKVVAYVPASVLYAQASQLLTRLLMLYGVVLVLVVILSWYLAYSGAIRRNHELQLAASEGRLRALSTQLLTAQETERRSVSRDLHDELGQLVTAVTLDLQRAAGSADPVKQADLISRALHGTDCLLDRIHEISSRIRPTLLDDLGLKDAVQNLLGEFERRTGIVPRADLHFGQNELPAVVSENVYRILQEALTNVAKHARAGEVFIGLNVAAASIALTVRDEGAGFNPDALDGKCLGLLGMRERAELLGGSFAVQSASGKGTTIQVTLPIHP